MEEPTLRTLLGQRDLRLRLISDQRMLPAGALEHPLRWVHSSDLADPTPFLADDLVLLTTGSQFADDDATGAAAYVSRLHDRGVRGLGFGTDVHRAGVPAELVEACAEAALPLFEVPYLTPFIAIARAHAEAIAARTYARRTWALEAQRALAIAALRPRPLESTLTELARRLGHWVGMFDAAGALAHEHPAGRVPADRIGELSVRTIELAARGDQAGDSLTAGPDSFALFTLGPTGNLRGTIAVATATLDAEARAVVTSAIAMTGLTLQQNEQLARDRRRLRSELLVTLRRDDPALARTVLGSLPQAPVLVAVAEHGAPADAITQFGDRLRSLSGSRVFDAEAPEGLTICVSNADAGMLDAIAERFGIRLGVSEPAGYDAFSHAHRQAVVALRHGRAGAAHYAATADSSILSALSGDEARLIAEARLAPLRAQEGLIQTLRVWLEHDARFESAARDLGIHRHTLRARVAQASRLLGTDLGTFPARAELWAALLAAG